MQCTLSYLITKVSCQRSREQLQNEENLEVRTREPATNTSVKIGLNSHLSICPPVHLASVLKMGRVQSFCPEVFSAVTCNVSQLQHTDWTFKMTQRSCVWLFAHV